MRRQQITLETKLRLYNTCILPIFLYGSEVWSVTSTVLPWRRRSTYWILGVLDVSSTFTGRILSLMTWFVHIRDSHSLSGACQEDVAASTSVRHAGLSQARRLADARPKLSGRRSSSTVLSQVCLGLSVLRRQSLGGPKNKSISTFCPTSTTV